MSVSVTVWESSTNLTLISRYFFPSYRNKALLKVALFSELLRATRFHFVASGAPIFGNNWNTSLEQSNHEMETSTIDFQLGSTKRSSWPHLSSELRSSIRKHWNLLSDPYLAWASPPFGWCNPNIFLRGWNLMFPVFFHILPYVSQDSQVGMGQN